MAKLRTAQPRIYDGDAENALLHRVAAASPNMRKIALRDLVRHDQAYNEFDGWNEEIVAAMEDDKFEGLLNNLLEGLKQETIGAELKRLQENMMDIVIKRAENLEQPQAVELVRRAMQATVERAENPDNSDALQSHLDQALFVCGKEHFLDGPYKHTTRVHFVAPAVNYFARRFVAHRGQPDRHSRMVSGNAVESLSKILANYESRIGLAQGDGGYSLHPLIARNIKDIHAPSDGFRELESEKGLSVAIEMRLRCS